MDARHHAETRGDGGLIGFVGGYVKGMGRGFLHLYAASAISLGMHGFSRYA